ncbi:EscU/YscU/HrcU family type III secretion system export apparatus switch protein [Acetobacterium tundrae]|uniref:Type III secretion protein n=1 Tax=Acetobacterium tundrae TaxID=132932 RepID=A0ABR6WLK9_9FIRM|nr:EscU/YscU/HrcU family type III secretion system export apparatus switch protein [Acetobacterium tundrae]MBC3797050.1 type III secretion protein [Acetobacterium tundrae]
MSPSKKKKAVPNKELPEKEKTLRVSALKYDPKKNNAPVIVAAGTGFVAQNILNVAEKSGIPVYHDDSAATLLSKLEMGQEVPPELFQIVVNIYISLLNLAEGNEVSDKVFK